VALQAASRRPSAWECTGCEHDDFLCIRLPVPEHLLDDPDLLRVGDLDGHHGADRRVQGSHHDISGWAKAAWIVLIIVLPFVGVLIYLIAYSAGIAERRG
jgi:hypothetical protein